MQHRSKRFIQRMKSGTAYCPHVCWLAIILKLLLIILLIIHQITRLAMRGMLRKPVSKLFIPKKLKIRWWMAWQQAATQTTPSQFWLQKSWTCCRRRNYISSLNPELFQQIMWCIYLFFYREVTLTFNIIYRGRSHVVCFCLSSIMAVHMLITRSRLKVNLTLRSIVV